MPELPWESGSLELPLPENLPLTWLEPSFPDPLSRVELLSQLNREFPVIAQQIKKAARIALILEDPSRPSHTRELIEAIIRKIQETRGELTGVTVIIAAGAHYRIEPAMLAPKLPALQLPVLVHDATTDSDLAHMGFSRSGVPLWFNRNVVEAELRLSISTVNLHPLAGFSGGGKILLPGVAGIETIRGLHRLPAGTPGSAQSPMRDLIDEVLDRLPIAYCWHLLSRPDGGIFRVLAGSVRSTHRQAQTELLRLVTMAPPANPPQLLILGAHPFHQNLIGSFKSLHQIPTVLAPGGCAILFNEAIQGVGFHHWRNDPAHRHRERKMPPHVSALPGGGLLPRHPTGGVPKSFSGRIRLTPLIPGFSGSSQKVYGSTDGSDPLCTGDIDQAKGVRHKVQAYYPIPRRGLANSLLV